MRYAWLLLLPLLNTGCTALMWDHATRTHDSGVYVIGTTHDSAGRQVVVHYGGSDTYYALPTDADGRLTGPVVYTGFGRTAREIADDLAGPQREALSAFRFSSGDQVTPSRVKFGGASSSIQIRELGCVAVALDHSDRPLETDLLRQADGTCERVLADDARIVLLPQSHPRTSDERRASVITAALLTPLTLAGDVVFSPIWVPFMLSDAYP